MRQILLTVLIVITITINAYPVYADHNTNSAGEKNIEIPKNCPKCNILLKKVPILYGEPTREAMEMATKKEIVLGGCLVYKGQPNYAFVCLQCGDIIGKYLIEEDDIREEEICIE